MAHHVFVLLFITLDLLSLGNRCHFDIKFGPVFLFKLDTSWHIFRQIFNVERMNANLLEIEWFLLFEVCLN